MSQMRTEIGLVLKHVFGGAEKINAVNYLAKPPPPNDEGYYAETVLGRFVFRASSSPNGLALT